MKTIAAALAAAALSAAPASAAAPERALERAQKAWQPGGGIASHELTPLLRDLALALPELRGADRRAAQALLARPTDGPTDPQQNGYAGPEAPGSPACSLHFCVHWTATGDDAPDPTDSNVNGTPDYVDTVLTTSENVYDVENGQLGWRPPKPDAAIGGSAQTDVYLKQLGGRGLYGYAAPDPGQRPTATDHSVYAYLVLDDDYARPEFPQYASPLTPLQVTMAHEYNHVLQFGYDFFQDTWMLESTATWMEGKVYPEALDYLQYLPGWARLTTLPLTTFNSRNQGDPRNVKVYGTAVWNKWLDARYGQEVVRGAWEASLLTDPPSFAVEAYERSIRNAGGASFAAEFNRFAAATAEWRSQPAGFGEGRLYPEVRRAATTSVGGRGSTRRLNHTTYALIGVRRSGAARIRLGVRSPAGTSSALALVGRASNGQVVVTLRELPKGGGGVVTLRRPAQFSRLTAVLVNSDTQVREGEATSTGDFIYKRDRQPFYARVSTDLTRPKVRLVESSVRGRRPRLKLEFSEPVLGVGTNSVQLIAANGRAVDTKVTRSGERIVVLTPRSALGAGRRYRVRVTPEVTDTTVNPLARTLSFAFTVKR